MEKSSKFGISFAVVLIVSSLTMIAGYPKLYSPYSFVVVIPAFMVYALDIPKPFLYFLAALPNAAFFLIWSIYNVKEKFLINKATLVLSCIFVTLSLLLCTISYSYGVKYQGLSHTLLMYAYNLFFIGSLYKVYLINRISPTINNCLLFNLLLFSWLGWSAFPWLGELI